MSGTASVLPVRLILFFSIILLLLCMPRAVVNAAAPAATEQVQVLAHLPLNGMHVNQMFVQQRDHKSFLYLHRPGKNAYALVDVTRPGKPVLVSRRAIEEPARAQVNPPAPGSLLAITVKPDATAHLANASSSPSAARLDTETIQLMDLSDPQHPKILKSFEGVTSMYPDDARKLVYIANSDGLWIIRHHAIRPLPVCSSADALNPLPDCQ